jgi:hypothetical protein
MIPTNSSAMKHPRVLPDTVCGQHSIEKPASRRERRNGSGRQACSIAASLSYSKIWCFAVHHSLCSSIINSKSCSRCTLQTARKGNPQAARIDLFSLPATAVSDLSLGRKGALPLTPSGHKYLHFLLVMTGASPRARLIWDQPPVLLLDQAAEGPLAYRGFGSEANATLLSFACPQPGSILQENRPSGSKPATGISPGFSSVQCPGINNCRSLVAHQRGDRAHTIAGVSQRKR